MSCDAAGAGRPDAVSPSILRPRAAGAICFCLRILDIFTHRRIARHLFPFPFLSLFLLSSLSFSFVRNGRGILDEARNLTKEKEKDNE
jgi:hypothetical protein